MSKTIIRNWKPLGNNKDEIGGKWLKIWYGNMSEREN